MIKGIMFWDLEVDNNPYYGAIASPRHPDNYVVMMGQAIDYQPYEGEITYKHYLKKEDATGWIKIPEDVWLIVAHNFSFELDWMLEQEFAELSKFIKRGGKLWCTQLAEYRLSRQTNIYPTLEETAMKYGGDPKIDLVKLAWKKGKLTSQINPDLLRDYLIGTDKMEGDIGNTRLAFYGQWMEAQERGMLDAILEQNNALLYNAVCMNNGLKIDLEVAHKNLDKLNERLAEVDTLIRSKMLESGVTQEGVDSFKFSSDFHKSAWVYGGTYQFDAKVPSMDAEGNFKYEKQDVVFSESNKSEYIVVAVGEDLEKVCAYSGMTPVRYKLGKRKGEIKVERIDSNQIKMINGKKQEVLLGLVVLTKYPQEFVESFESKYKQARELQCETPVMSTSEDAILELISRPETSKLAKEVLTLFREWAILNKVIGAFFDRQEFYANGTPKARSGMLQFVTEQGIIHHSLNSCATKTGRLSSTKPNLQQVPRDDRDGVMQSNIKEMFVSRFGDQGRIVEIDYNALEVRIMADFAGDTNLMQAILDGTDMHSLRASAFHGYEYEYFRGIVKDEKHPEHLSFAQKRQGIKSPSFAYQYGASAHGIAYATGWTISDSQAFIDNERKLFPHVEIYFEEVAEKIEKTKKINRVRLEDGRYDVHYTGYLKAQSGFEYHYRTQRKTVWDAGRKYGVDEFKPTEMRNYIMQGDASLGVQLSTGELIRHLFKVDFYDSRCYPINTVHDAVMLDVHEDVVEQVCGDVVRILEDLPKYMAKLGYNLKLPYPVEATYGLNWQDQTETFIKQ